MNTHDIIIEMYDGKIEIKKIIAKNHLIKYSTECRISDYNN